MLTIANCCLRHQPRSAEPTGGSAAIVNGTSAVVAKEDEAATDSADEFPSGAVAPTAGVTNTTSRSVSATLQHERERPRGAGSRASPRSSNASDSRVVGSHRSSHAHPSASQHSAYGGSPQTARESFLNYIFGQNGPGPIGASSVVGAAPASSAASGHYGGTAVAQQGADVVVASGRDTSGGEDVLLRSGLLAGKHDGSSAAYDMKSLGKHIEAVTSSIPRTSGR